MTTCEGFQWGLGTAYAEPFRRHTGAKYRSLTDR